MLFFGDLILGLLGTFLLATMLARVYPKLKAYPWLLLPLIVLGPITLVVAVLYAVYLVFIKTA